MNSSEKVICMFHSSRQARKEEWQKERDSVQQERREKRVQKKRLREEKLAGNVPLEVCSIPKSPE